MGWDTALPCPAARSSSFFAILRVCFLSLEYNGDLSLPLSPSFSLLKGNKEGGSKGGRAEQWSIVFHGWISWGRKFVTMRFSEGEKEGRGTEEGGVGRRERERDQSAAAAAANKRGAIWSAALYSCHRGGAMPCTRLPREGLRG